jgi:hypothetical protein
MSAPGDLRTALANPSGPSDFKTSRRPKGGRRRGVEGASTYTHTNTVSTSVADPGCLFRIPDPDFYPSRIQQVHQKRRGKKLIRPTIFCSHKYHKIAK